MGSPLNINNSATRRMRKDMVLHPQKTHGRVFLSLQADLGSRIWFSTTSRTALFKSAFFFIGTHHKSGLS
jgi:hypothetical protein